MIALYIEIRYLYVAFEIVRFFTVKIRRTRVPNGNEGAQFALCPPVERRVDRAVFLCQKANRAVKFSERLYQKNDSLRNAVPRHGFIILRIARFVHCPHQRIGSSNSAALLYTKLRKMFFKIV